MDHNFLLEKRKETKAFINSPHIYQKGPVKSVLEFRKRLDSTSALEKGELKSKVGFQKNSIHPPAQMDAEEGGFE